MKQLLDPGVLTSPTSPSLNKGSEGWFSPAATQSLETDLNSLTWAQTYVCHDSTAATGDKQSGMLSSPESSNPPFAPFNSSFICNPCELTVCFRAEKVKFRDQFWIKDQEYFPCDMLNGNTYAKRFDPRTVYQTHLSPKGYHRWQV
ncbi:hypothetical protein PAXINDRAFT_101228 [Paxillus involutus ATCC 200175]|uniref:Uncharacterized protein n=1 Tax=Paxillus involutus ATCC 200175 TaxID=664439 RepID=A0A0C9STY5_PAXIN|nr:hypothetical protein PAXINDRAFT_101228 [Paxillus involutus ATCC 200175]